MKRLIKTALVAVATLGVLSLTNPTVGFADGAAARFGCQNAKCDGITECEYSSGHGCCMAISGTSCETISCVFAPQGCA